MNTFRIDGSFDVSEGNLLRTVTELGSVRIGAAALTFAPLLPFLLPLHAGCLPAHGSLAQSTHEVPLKKAHLKGKKGKDS